MAPLGSDGGSGSMVTSKGAGLNPNAKVCQEMPVSPSEAVSNSPHWPPADISEGYSEPSSAGCKPLNVGFTALDDSSSSATAEIAVNGMDPPELGSSPAESTTGTPGQSRGRDVGQHQLSSQGELAEYHPRPMHSPPPLRRASLPLFTKTYNAANPAPPLLNTLAQLLNPPLSLDALESGSSQALQTDTSSLFDFRDKLDYQTSGQQNNPLSHQLQTSYPSTQPQHQPQASLSRMAYLTPSPYLTPSLTPNPPDSSPTSYLTFGPEGNSTGIVTYSTGGQA